MKLITSFLHSPFFVRFFVDRCLPPDLSSKKVDFISQKEYNAECIFITKLGK